MRKWRLSGAVMPYKNKEDKRAAVRRAYYKAQRDNPRLILWQNAKANAKKRQCVFNLAVEDIQIPEYCPVFPDLKLELLPIAGKRSDASLSLDRLIPERGYVPGNVSVISWRANRIKNDGSYEDHLAITEWMRRALESQT